MTAAESKSGFNIIPTRSKMYGLKIVQYRDVSQIYPPCCVLTYRANGQKCPLLKNEQNAEKTAKVFLEALGTRSKKSRFRFDHSLGERMHGGLSAFRAYQGRGSLLPPLRSTAFYRRRIQPSEFRTVAVWAFHGLPYRNTPLA